MSVQAITWAYQQKTSSPLGKFLLVTVANYANERFEAWPSKSRLANDMCCSESAVCNHLRRLQEEGLVDVQPRWIDGVQIPSKIILLTSPEARGVVHHVEGGSSCEGGGGPPRGGGVVHHVDTEPSLEPSIEPTPAAREPRKAKKSQPVDDGSFDPFWDAYPRKVAKADAAKAWAKLKAEDRAAAMAAIPAFIAKLRREKTEEKFIKYPASWLNGRRFEDFASAPPKTVDPKKGPDLLATLEELRIEREREYEAERAEQAAFWSQKAAAEREATNRWLEANVSG